MSLVSLPKILAHSGDGSLNLFRIHPSVAKTFLAVVVPMSLIPPLMYAYAQRYYPGEIAPLVVPPLTIGELVLVGTVFFGIELATVTLMAFYIQQLAESVGIRPRYSDAFTLAALAPIPLWLSTLALAVPSAWVTFLAVSVAWLGSVAIIRRGVRPLLGVDDDTKARRLANAITLTGVATWVALMVVLNMLLGMTFAYR